MKKFFCFIALFSASLSFASSASDAERLAIFPGLSGNLKQMIIRLEDPNIWTYALGSHPSGLDPIYPSGEENIETINTDYFSHVDISGFMDVDVVGGQPGGYIQIIGDTHYLNQIHKEIRKGKIQLTLNKHYVYPPPRGPLHAIIYVKQLSDVQCDGCGDINVTGINQGHLALRLTDVGDVNIDKTRATLSIHANGAEHIDVSGPRVHLHDLVTDFTTSVNISQIVSDHLNVHLDHTGDTYLLGAHIGLNRLAGHSKGYVRISHIRTNNLDIDLDNHGAVELIGQRIGLNKLALRGPGTMEIDNIDTDHLDLKTAGHGQISIKGIAHLKSVNFSGNDSLYLYWVKSHRLDIKGSGGAHYHLAGTADELTATLSGNALLDTKYLQTQHVAVTSSGHAKAIIYSNNTLTAFAINNACVDYYGSPVVTTLLNHGASTIVRMEGLDLAACHMTQPIFYPDGHIRSTCTFPDYYLKPYTSRNRLVKATKK